MNTIRFLDDGSVEVVADNLTARIEDRDLPTMLRALADGQSASVDPDCEFAVSVE